MDPANEPRMTAEDAAALRAPFPPEQIGKLPKGGAMLDFVGHAAITDRLLQVDPEWTWEPLALDDRGLPALDSDGNLWIRLTIRGVTRLGVGDGKSAKERIGDALRNGAMRFGVALDLWSRQDLSGQMEHPDGPLDVSAFMADLTARIWNAETEDDLRGFWRQINQQAQARRLPEPERDILFGIVEERRVEIVETVA
jgi:hypothetical protein